MDALGKVDMENMDVDALKDAAGDLVPWYMVRREQQIRVIWFKYKVIFIQSRRVSHQ